MLLAVAVAAAMSVAVSAEEPPRDDSEAIAAMEQWLNGLTVTPRDQNGDPLPTLTAEELAAYADTVYALVNQERERAGVPLLERDTSGEPT